jgi:hypothetical protein
MSVADYAHAWHAAGFCAVPVKGDGSKAPALNNWTELQARLPNDVERRNWWTPDRQGYGLIMGAVSGNAEMLEFEGRMMPRISEVASKLTALGLQTLFLRLWCGYREVTPSGGVHLIFRLSDGPALGNVKIARRPATSEELEADPKDKVKTLIETRGEGGFTVTAPSNGTTHPSGGQWVLQSGQSGVVPVITCAERDALYEALRSFDEMPQVERTEHKPRSSSSDVFSGSYSNHVSPLDHFNNEADWSEILVPQGWVHSRVDNNGTAYWIRPGKDTPGESATTGRSDTGDRLYVFSSSTPFETETPLSKAYVWAHYNHGGDLKAAAASLYEQGWGDRRRDTQSAIGDDVPLYYCDDEGRVEDDPINDLFDSRPILRHIRHAARALQADPLAVLGVTMARALAGVPPNIVLPPIIGGQVSVNMMVVAVGESGDGKGVANAASRAAVEIIPNFACRDMEASLFGSGDETQVHETGLGTGQGIISRYVMREKNGDLVPRRYSVLFDVPEIDTIAAHAKMTGATVMSVLRSIYMGERLGDAYKDPKKDLHIAAHQVRCCLIISGQPCRCGVLIDDAAGGTPQRMLWVPTDDLEYGPQNDIACPEAVVLDLNPQGSGMTPGQLVDVRVCEEAIQAIKGARRARRNLKRAGRTADGLDLDGHRLLNREKLAYGLAVLDGRFTEINSEDWELAEILLEFSDAVRDRVQTALMEAAARETDQRAASRGRAQVIQNQTQAQLERENAEDVRKKIVDTLRAHPGSTKREIGNRCRSAQRWPDLEGLLEEMITDGDLRRDDTGRSVRLFVAEEDTRDPFEAVPDSGS